MELRALGVGLERLMLLKDYFYGSEEYLQALNRITLGEYSIPPQGGVVTTSYVGFEPNMSQSEIEMMKTYEGEGTSRLLHHILDVIVNRHVKYLRLSSDGRHDFFELSEMQTVSNDDHADTNPNWYKLLNMRSCVIVNLTNIISEITQTHEIFKVEQNKISFKRTAESLIRELFNEKNIIEVTIRLTNKEEPLLLVKRELSYRELHQKVNSLQKRGVFRDISIKTRDGNVSRFESIDLIKL
jgi:hypothetical protein